MGYDQYKAQRRQREEYAARYKSEQQMQGCLGIFCLIAIIVAVVAIIKFWYIAIPVILGAIVVAAVVRNGIKRNGKGNT